MPAPVRTLTDGSGRYSAGCPEIFTLFSRDCLASSPRCRYDRVMAWRMRCRSFRRPGEHSVEAE